MDTPLLAILSAVISILLLAVLAGLFLLLRQRPVGGSDLSAALQTLAQSAQQAQSQMAMLGERLSRLDVLPPAMSGIQVEVRGLAERVATVERNQSASTQGLTLLTHTLAQTGANITSELNAEIRTAASGLTGAVTVIRGELAQAQQELASLQASLKAQNEAEQRAAASLRRLETIIAGTQTKGAAGENILEAVFAKLPPEWQVRNFKINGRPVEFGLRLPNNLILPIDSKWAATSLLEQFYAASDLDEQRRLKAEIESVVLRKAQEVRKYLDPNLTLAFGVAVVPDAVYDLCAGIQAEVFQMSVVLVSYGLFVPYLLLVFQTVLKTGQSVDLHKLQAYLQTAQETIRLMQEEVDGRFSRALTMMGNSRDDLRAHLGKLGGGLTGLQISTAEAAVLPASAPQLPEPPAAPFA